MAVVANGEGVVGKIHKERLRCRCLGCDPQHRIVRFERPCILLDTFESEIRDLIFRFFEGIQICLVHDIFRLVMSEVSQSVSNDLLRPQPRIESAGVVCLGQLEVRLCECRLCGTRRRGANDSDGERNEESAHAFFCATLLYVAV